MKIHSITITNFLCYYGTNKILFEDGLNLVLGANGYGKSKLYDAFQWVFKDGITDDSAPEVIKNTSLIKRELISEKALIECAAGDKVFCEVVVDVSDSSSTYQLKRKYFVSKKHDGTFIEATLSSFEVYEKDVVHFKPLDEDTASKIPNRLISSEVMPYVWFQGEKGVNKIIDTSNKVSLKKVIEKLSDIEKWDKYLAIIEKAYSTATTDFNRELKNNARNRQEYDIAEDAYNKNKKAFDIDIEEFKNANENLEAATSLLDSILGKLDSAQKITELDGIRKQKMLDLEATIAEIDKSNLGFSKRLFQDYWLLMGTEKLVSKFEDKYNTYNDFVNQRKVTEALEKSEFDSTTRLPRGIPERMHVQRMLDLKKCLVCGTLAPVGSKEYKEIEKLLPIPKATKVIESTPDIESELRRLYNIGFSISEKFSNAEDEIVAAIENKENLIKKKSELQDALVHLDTEISNEILNSGVDRATDIVSMATVASQDIQKYSGEVGRLKLKKERDEEELRKSETKLKQLSQGTVDPLFLAKKELLDNLVELTKRVKAKQYKGLVDQLERTSNVHYENINKPTGAFYGRIKFVETTSGGYIPENYDDSGQRISNLNTSLTSSLKLSIILAIMTANQNRGYNNRYPLIADAPISDFDPSKKKSFLVEAANTFNQSIVIIYDFLDIDTERTNRFKPNIPKLKELKDEIEKRGKNLTIHNLDIPDGITTTNRKELSITINPVNIK